MNNIIAVILAAGEGKRMKSNHSKVAHKVCGIPMIKRVCDEVKSAGVDKTVVIIGHKGEEVKELMGEEAFYALQKEQLGTGHAIAQAKSFLEKSKKVIVLCGDAPLIRHETIEEAIKEDKKNNRVATIFTANFNNPTGCGRIIRNGKNEVIGIVEEKDATEAEKRITEVNSSIYIFDSMELIEALAKVDNKNAQGEYYLTDVIKIMVQGGKSVGAYQVVDKNEIMGVNSRSQLAMANKIAYMRTNEFHMQNGVTIIDTNNTYIDENVKIGKDTIIYPGTILEDNTKIGEESIIGPNTRLTNTEVLDNTNICYSVAIDSKIGNNVNMGPFSYLRPNSHIKDNIKIGDFVEIKNSTIDNGTKIPHLSYVGDSDVGKNVNFGCGSMTVNYDGVLKHRTTVEDNAFIGCNTNLVAPINIGKRVYTAAGTTVTKDVPDDSLVIGRCRQEVKEGWTKGKIKGC